MLVDRHRLRRKLRDARQQQGQGEATPESEGGGEKAKGGKRKGRGRRQPRRVESLEQLQEQVLKSVERYETRERLAPTPTFDDQLPITAHREALRDALQQHQVLVVCGETGSGKSTQLPKICLEAGRGIAGMIGHTQPRRIAARSIASRLAQELRGKVGDQVGFKVRFDDETTPNTFIKLMTDGILLAETQNDRFLNQYDTLILDEAHERSLNIDFLIGYLRRLLPKRSDLRLIITSATIDVERFCQHFASDGKPAPLVEVSGRAYPVEVRYRPPEQDEVGEQQDPEKAIVAGVEEVMAEGPGDVLVFLPTERDIRDASRVLRGWSKDQREPGGIEILPLYARLSTAEQQRVFQSHKGRRIVLATNVAESSLTVPGIRYVVDSGTARISRYAARSKVQRLPIEPVSQASAEQRKGRCGRIGPGVCVRLYSEEDFLSRDAFTTPEIRRTNLASVVLQTEALRLGAIDEFPFMEPPRHEAIREAYKTLFELGAVDGGRRLTPLGRRLSHLPVDPRIGRMILAGEDFNCLNEVLIIASALELPDPRQRPVEKQQAADEAHTQHAHPESDFLALLNLWDFYHDLRQKLSRSQLRKALQQNFLSPLRMQEWIDIHRQLRQLATGAGMKTRRRQDDYKSVHRALLSGLLSNIAQRGDKHEYNGPGGTFHLWPGSGVFQAKPKWVIAAELVETTRRYLRGVARIDPGWIEPAAQHLVKRSHSDPHWSDKSGNAMTYEKVTLFGLTISSRRRVPLAPLDPPLSRQMLIQHGLAEVRLRNQPDFLRHNQQVVEQIRDRAARSRERSLVVDEMTLCQLYEQRIPEHVTDPARLNRWLKDERRQNRKPLHFSEEDLAPPDDSEKHAEFPTELAMGQLNLPVTYRFEPGDEDDGVSITVPAEALNQLSDDRLGWLVPGLIEEKVLGLIRSLPKSLRRNFVPAPDTAREVVKEIEDQQGSAFLDSVARALTRRSDERVTASDFRLESLDPHLHLNLKVIDEKGELVASSRNLQELRERFGAVNPQSTARVIDHQQWNRDGIKKWDFGDLPASVEIQRGSVTLPTFPAIVDQGDSVGLRRLDSESAAQRATHFGARRLFVLAERKELSSQVKWLPGLDKQAVLAAGLADAANLRDELVMLLADMAFYQSGKLAPPRTEEAFQDQRKQGALWITPAAQELTQVMGPLLENYHHLRLQLEQLGEGLAEVTQDVRRQLDELVKQGFLSNTPWEWLQHMPRYLKAAALRLDKARSNLQRDRQHYATLAPLQQRWDELSMEEKLMPGFEKYRWMLEELRVSLFAQELGTSCTVSPKRLEKQWDSV